MNDDDDWYAPYVAAYAETMRRHENAEPLRAEDLLMLLRLLNGDIALMHESVEKIAKTTKPITNDLANLRGHIAAVHKRFQLWRTTFLHDA
jgi:hypothetical protein